jgi:hypothetical protein
MGCNVFTEEGESMKWSSLKDYLAPNVKTVDAMMEKYPGMFEPCEHDVLGFYQGELDSHYIVIDSVASKILASISEKVERLWSHERGMLEQI